MKHVGISMVAVCVLVWHSVYGQFPITDPCPGEKHKIRVFFSPDHSLKPLLTLIDDAQSSLDMYIPDIESWTHKVLPPTGVPVAMLRQEKSPLFRAIANAGVRKVKIRVITNGPGVKATLPMMVNWQTYLVLQQPAGPSVAYRPASDINALIIIVDGGKKVFYTTMSTSGASFLYNRESSVILDSMCSSLSSFFTNTFALDFATSIPHQPDYALLTGTATGVPLISPIDLATINAKKMDIDYDTLPHQPPQVLNFIRLGATVTEVLEFDDVEYIKAMIGPSAVKMELDHIINSANVLQLAIRSIPSSDMCDMIDKLRLQGARMSILLSYTLEDETELKDSDACIKKLYYAGMFTDLYRGPLYDSYTPSKDYYTHSGQAYMIINTDTVYFMTGTFSDDDIPPTALDSGKLKNIYVGLKSKMLAYKLSTIYANEATRADGWNPEAQTVLGNEKEVYDKEGKADELVLNDKDGDQGNSDGDQAKGDGDQAKGDGDQAKGDEDQGNGDGDQAKGNGDQGDGDQANGDGDQAKGDGDQAKDDGDQGDGDGDQANGDGDQAKGDGDQAKDDGDQGDGDGDQANNGDGDQAKDDGDQGDGDGDQGDGDGDQANGDGDQAKDDGDQGDSDGDQANGDGDRAKDDGDQGDGDGDQANGDGDRAKDDGDQGNGDGDQANGDGDQAKDDGDQGDGDGDQANGDGDQGNGDGDQGDGDGDQGDGDGDQANGDGDQGNGDGDQANNDDDQSKGDVDQED